MSNSAVMTLLGRMHEVLVHRRRVRITAQLLAERFPQNAKVLDIGCGDGSIAWQIQQLRPDIKIRGVEVLARPACKIECDPYDGARLPFEDNAFDACVLVDVLHHTEDVTVLLKEARRVSKSIVLLRDHLSENGLDHLTLRALDWAGNGPHGVRMTYNYQSREKWERAFCDSGLREENWSSRASTYLPPVNWIAGRRLHFIAVLKKENLAGQEAAGSSQSPVSE